MPGFAPIGGTPLATLPAGHSLATQDPIRALLAKPELPRSYLLEASPIDPATGLPVSVRISDDAYRTAPGDGALPNVRFLGALASAHSMQLRVMEGGKLLHRSTPAYGDLEILNPDARFDYLTGYSWGGRRLQVKVGSPTFPYASFGPIRTGVAEEPSWDFERITLPARDPQYILGKPIQNRFYRGTNNCLRLDGLNDYGSLGSYAAAAEVTVDLCFRCVGNNSAGTVQVIAAHGTGWSTTGLDWNLQVDTAGILSAHVNRASGADVSITHAGRDYRDGQWHQLALVIAAGANGCRLFVDGASIGTATAPAASPITGSLYIGAQPSGTAGFFRGDLDEIRLWKVARSADDIRSGLIGELANPSASTLTAYHKLNDLSGTSPTATIGTNGTVFGGPLWVGSLEGGAEIAGKPKPLAFGQIRQFEPILVDPFALIYQVHDGPIAGSLVARDLGIDFTSDGDTSDLQAGTVTAGRCKTDLSRGLLRLNAKPAGTLTCDFQGDALGGYVSTSAAILRRVVQRFGGLADADLDVGSFAAADLANGAVHGLAVRLEPQNMDELADRLMGSIGGWWTYTRGGLLQVRVLADPALGTPVAKITDADIVKRGARRLPSVPPSRGQRLGYRRNYETLSGNQASSTLSADLRAQYGEDLRYSLVENPGVVSTYADAQVWSDETLMDSADASTAEAARRQGLFGIRRDTYAVSLVNGLYQFWVGDVIELALSRWSLSTGRRFVVVGVSEDSTSRETVLEVWG